MSTIEVRTQAALDKALASVKPGDIIACVGKAEFSISGSATVRASGSATVRAGKYVAIHVAASGRSGITITGGVVIETPDVVDAASWVDYHGADVVDGRVAVFKALDDDWSTDNARRVGIAYVPGTEVVEAPDWAPVAECGRGLHASARPDAALAYNPGATRYVRCRAKLDELVVIDEAKIKAPRLYGPFVAVDIDGAEIAS